MANRLSEMFRAPTILDGAWGTELFALGLPPGACPDEWNLSHPDQVASVARAYVEAKSDVILTNTFGANRITLSAHGLASRVQDINRVGATISVREASGRARVFASVGPTGKSLVTGEVSLSEVRSAYQEQIPVLADTGIDGLVLETFSDLDELRIAMEVALHAGLVVVACMVFDGGPSRDCTLTGVTLEEAGQALSADGADGVGSNCGRGVESYLPLVKRLRQATTLPLWIKPNAGLPVLVEGQTTYPTSPEQFAAGARGLFESGVTFIGGCCGTSPVTIRAIRRELCLGS